MGRRVCLGQEGTDANDCLVYASRELDPRLGIVIDFGAIIGGRI